MSSMKMSRAVSSLTPHFAMYRSLKVLQQDWCIHRRPSRRLPQTFSTSEVDLGSALGNQNPQAAIGEALDKRE
jgi:hypothetical protein